MYNSNVSVHKYSIIGSSHSFVYPLSVAALPCAAGVKELRQRPSGLHSLK